MEQKIQKQFSEHEMKEVAKVKETTMTTAIPNKQVNAVEIPQMTAKEIREEPRQKPVDEIIKRGNSPKPINPVSSVKEKKKIEGIDWKDCVKVLNMHTHVPNPHSKFASSIFHHPVTEINNQKNIFKLEVEQFLASHGVTQTAMAQKHKNPAMKIICEQLSELIDDHRQKSTTIACYDQMRNFISTQIDAASSQGYRTGPPPLKIDTGVKSSLVSLKSPRTSSSPTKSVKISDEAKLETKQRNYPRKWYFEDRASDDAKSISDTSPSRSSISSNSRAQSPSDEIEPQTSPTKSSGPMASIKRSFSIKAKETIFNTFKDVASKMNPLRRKQSADERFQSMILEQSKMVQSPSMITAPIQSPTEKKRREDDSSSTETEGSESEEDESSDGIYSSIKASRTETSASETASSISNKTPSKAVPRSVPKSNTLLEALNEEEEGAEVPKVFKSKITLKPTKAVNNNRNTETSQTQSSSCASSLSDFPISEISAPITPPEKRNPDVTDAQSDPPSEEMIDFLNNMNTKVEVLNQAPQKTQQSQQIMVFDDISDFDD
ncbi:hypothetical protein BC833DRAFT_372426 [Globomyces pollinis-pini]|nr:hypothetical protein BC833DRAFT_372426 [Globomyces pollinis-pini]